MEPLRHLGQIAYTVIGPIVVLVGAGYLIGRRVPAASEVLAKILLYLLIPIYVFLNVLGSSLAGAEYGYIILFSALVLVILLGLARAASAVRRHDPPLRGAFANTAILYNSANFAIPVMALAYSFDAAQETYAVAVQVVVAACQGLAAYTVGTFIAAAGAGPVRHALWKILGLPFMYALAAALVLKQCGLDAAALAQVTILWKPMTIICGAYVPMALMTLGAQMACVKVVRAPVDLALSVFLRLVMGPVAGLVLVKVLGLEGLLAQILVIGASGPSAVASAVVAIEFKNRPDFAASAVLLSTLGAGVTVPVVIFLAQRFL
jgi:hypothetical protein